MKKPDYIAAKAQISMSDILKHYLNPEEFSAFTEKGEQLRGSCILCETKKRSTLSINTKRNCYQSFCCKSKGNILDFVAEMEEVTIDDAVGLIFDWFEIEMETPDKEEQESCQAISTNDDKCNPLLSFELKNIDHCHERVQSLGISEKTAIHFGVGFYQGRGMFKDHVVFPIHNLDGDLIGYAGMDDERQFHYPEKFYCDLVLYNAHRVRESLIHHDNPIVIANSPYDTVRLYDTDIRHSMATMGSVISPQQLEIMSSVANVSAYDLKPQEGAHDVQTAYNLTEDEILAHGADILASRMKNEDVFTSPIQVKEFFKRKLSHLEREVFMCLYLDNKNRMIAFDQLFSGTVDQVSVYPREIAKQSLKFNASAVIAAHNHPSSDPTPSNADKAITWRVKDALALLEIRLLDHIIVGGNDTCSLAERGEV